MRNDMNIEHMVPYVQNKINMRCYVKCKNEYSNQESRKIHANWKQILQILHSVAGRNCVTAAGTCVINIFIFSVIVNEDFQTWLLIGLNHNLRQILSHVRESLLIGMDFYIDIFFN